ncbi:hypothetical protein IWZ00DRAFT_541121 [Phyllosticta capitalensis]|uniref:Uncharacterized protein n=1 Tax=Phyllosticta capitalensis TaxID=121624 RepID=A0ABR1Z4Y4_9PEZI
MVSEKDTLQFGNDRELLRRPEPAFKPSRSVQDWDEEAAIDKAAETPSPCTECLLCPEHATETEREAAIKRRQARNKRDYRRGVAFGILLIAIIVLLSVGLCIALSPQIKDRRPEFTQEVKDSVKSMIGSMRGRVHDWINGKKKELKSTTD